jgi:hypothetical protein
MLCADLSECFFDAGDATGSHVIQPFLKGGNRLLML